MRRFDDYDVVVLGGGPGGCGAAVCAARAGARTLLVEREGCLGGGATTMLVHPFMPHKVHAPAGQCNADQPLVNAGLYREVVDRLLARGKAKEGFCVDFDDEYLKIVLEELVREAGADILYHAGVYDVDAADGTVCSARLAHNGGPIEVKASVFIDATGDALPAELAGCEIMRGDAQGRVQPTTLNFIVGGVGTERMPGYGAMAQRCAAGGDDEPALINTNYNCHSIPRPGYVHFNAIRVHGDPLDPMDLSRMEIESRRRVENFVAWLKANVEGFEGCYLVKTGSHVGIRETRRVRGDYVLTYDDWKAGRRFDDGIAACSYSVDIHGQEDKSDESNEPMPPGHYYQVPYRCLTPRGARNLLIASRAISGDRQANGSYRIMPTVMNIGEAAGFAAAMALPSGDIRAVDIPALRDRLIAHGAALEPMAHKRARL
jgi:hypothetical protein